MSSRSDASFSWYHALIVALLTGFLLWVSIRSGVPQLSRMPGVKMPPPPVLQPRPIEAVAVPTPPAAVPSASPGGAPVAEAVPAGPSSQSESAVPAPPPAATAPAAAAGGDQWN